MKLRNFMYLNTKILEDYISVIDGFTYDEESQEIQNVNEKTLGEVQELRLFLETEKSQLKK